MFGEQWMLLFLWKSKILTLLPIWSKAPRLVTTPWKTGSSFSHKVTIRHLRLLLTRPAGGPPPRRSLRSPHNPAAPPSFLLRPQTTSAVGLRSQPWTTSSCDLCPNLKKCFLLFSWTPDIAHISSRPCRPRRVACFGQRFAQNTRSL